MSVEAHPIGCSIVREQPWRERFLCACVESTRVSEGSYAPDWDKFFNEWRNEMRLLERHRAGAGRLRFTFGLLDKFFNDSLVRATV